MFKRENLPMLLILGLLILLFVGPMVVMLIELILIGEFAFPTYVFRGVLAEVNLGFFFGLALLVVPVALVYLVDRARQRGVSQRRRIGLTLGLLMGLMLVMTAIPVVSFSGGFSALAASDITWMLFYAGLPLIAVALTAAIVLPEVGRIREN